jgi:hypothetical protein
VCGISTTATFPRLTFRRVKENPCSPDISPVIRKRIISIVADPGCYPGSEFFPSRMRSASKILNILIEKIVSKLCGNMIRVVHLGSGS